MAVENPVKEGFVLPAGTPIAAVRRNGIGQRHSDGQYDLVCRLGKGWINKNVDFPGF